MSPEGLRNQVKENLALASRTFVCPTKIYEGRDATYVRRKVCIDGPPIIDFDILDVEARLPLTFAFLGRSRDSDRFWKFENQVVFYTSLSDGWRYEEQAESVDIGRFDEEIGGGRCQERQRKGKEEKED